MNSLFAGPVSEDDLSTMSRSQKFTTASKDRSETPMIGQLLDKLRFPWVGDGRPPSPEERACALRWTAGIWAVEVARTRRRVDESREQERAVIDLVERAGFERQQSRRQVERPDEIPIGSYTPEVNLGGQKCDVSVRLLDGRLLGIECKVSNSELNSVKRLLREAGGKARQWQVLFGRQVVTAAVLRGVFRPANVLAAQEDFDIVVIWEHNLLPLSQFLVDAH